MWTLENEKSIVSRECVMCLNKMTCKIIEPMIKENGTDKKPREWGSGIGNSPPFCTEFNGEPVAVAKRDKYEARQREVKEQRRQLMEEARLAQIAHELEVENGLGKKPPEENILVLKEEKPNDHEPNTHAEGNGDSQAVSEVYGKGNS